ncbi:MAG TPA: GNAT family N-acetyltransferase [Methanocella sp.]|nr:GNAT family N-acetyltransferase [Methanocella sp.]
MDVTIADMSPADRDEVIAIFAEGVRAGDRVLDTDDPGTQDLAAGWNLVARAGGRIIGWATVEPARGVPRPGTAAIRVFVRPDGRGHGVGQALLDAAVGRAARNGIATLVARVVPQNVPALMLHKKSGFRARGVIRKAGVSHGAWHSAVLLELRNDPGTAAAAAAPGGQQTT